MKQPRATLCLGFVALGALACDNKGGTAPVPSAAATSTISASAKPVNVTIAPSASVEAALNPDKLPVYTGPTGSVEGTISVIGDPAPAAAIQDFGSCSDAAAMYAKQFRVGAATTGGAHALGDAVVAVIGYGGYYIPEQAEARRVSIHGCAFDTRTITLTYGQRLEVKNEGREFFGPELQNAPGLAVMLATPGGDPVKLYPPKPGHYILHDVRGHAFMIADVYAMLHPLHAVSDIAGHYRIDHVPVGKLEVHATHPWIPAEAKADVDIVEGVVKTVNLVITYHTPEAGPPVDAGSRSGVILR